MTRQANYDDVAALVRKRTEAEAVLVVVIGGKRGGGMAVQVRGKHLTDAEREDVILAIMRGQMTEAAQRQLGLEARDVAPAGGEIKGPPKLGAHHPNDNPEQAYLRVAVADELEAVCKKYDVGGVFALVGRQAAAWRTVFPTWVGIQPDPEHVLRVKFSSRDGDDVGSNTMFYIGAVREMCSDYANLFGRLWRQVSDTLRAQGATIEHTPLGAARTVGGRPDPLGGQSD